MVYVMRNGRRVIVALSFLLLCCGVHVHAQRVAVKTNALGWLTASPNVEAEFVLGSHVSLNIWIRMGAGRSLEHRSNCRSGCVALPSVQV